MEHIDRLVSMLNGATYYADPETAGHEGNIVTDIDAIEWTDGHATVIITHEDGDYIIGAEYNNPADFTASGSLGDEAFICDAAATLDNLYTIALGYMIRAREYARNNG